MRDLGLGAVVTAPVLPVGIGLKELSSPGGGNPHFLAKPSREMAAVEGMGGDLGRPLPKDVHGEVIKHLVHGMIQVLATRFTHALGITKMFQSVSRNSFQWCFGAM